MMSPEELNRYRSREFVRLAKSNFPELGGQKLNTVTDAALSDETPDVRALCESLFDRLSYKKVGRLCDLCKINYDPKMKVIKLTKKARLLQGKVRRYMGFKGCDGSTLLHPEEALFLMDCVVFILKGQAFLGDYLVYAHLIRAGYIVRRHTGENYRESGYEFKKRKKHMTGSFRNDYLSSIKKSNVSVVSKIDVDDAKPCSSRDELSGLGVNNLDCSKPLSLQTRWEFDKIQVPDDFGGSFIVLQEPKKEYLPFPLKYGKDRLLLRRDTFTKSRYKSTLLNKKAALIDQQRRADRQSFYRPKNWVFLDVQRFKTWQEFKRFKLKAANKASNAQRHQIASEIELTDYVPKSPSVSGFPSGRNLVTQFRFKILYDIHLSDSGFKLTKPIQPSFCLVVTDVDEPPPTNAELDVLSKSVGAKNAIRFAVVDNAEILFFDMTLRSSTSIRYSTSEVSEWSALVGGSSNLGQASIVSTVLCEERSSKNMRESFAHKENDSFKQGLVDAETLLRQKILYEKILSMKTEIDILTKRLNKSTV